jgi:hypothetical protein
MACATDASGAPAGLTGNWGGNQIMLAMTDTGGRLDLACATAMIDAPVRPDATGKFSATARYEAFTGGPTRADEPPATTPVHVMGHVEGDTLRLSMHREGAAAPEVYTLERGRRVKLIRCM